MSQTQPIGTYLKNVALLRPLAIFLLVIYHSFAVFCGAWALPANMFHIETYRWIAEGSYSFMLELFVMLSGLVWGHQWFNCNRRSSIRDIIGKKFKRLIIPSLIFGGFYFIIFGDYKTFISSVYVIANGIGHMWFLPMLFWCFLWGGVFLHKPHLITKRSLLFSACLSIVSIIPAPFQLLKALYYFYFFLLGIYITYLKIDTIKNKTLLKLIGSFLIIFVLFVHLTPHLKEYHNDGIIIKAIAFSIKCVARLIMSTVGCLIVYFLANGILYTLRIQRISRTWLYINQICFGIYLFQQFILKYLYYNTNLPTIFGTYWTPWIFFVIALLGSAILSIIIRKSRIGHTLIG